MLHTRIKELRKTYRISQVDLAKALGVTKQCVSNWENDNIQPSIDMLVKIANYFHVKTDYLLGLDEKDYLCILRSRADSDAFQSGRYAEHNGRPKTLKKIA